MAVIRRNVLTSPDTATYVAGVLALSRRGTSITPAQINGSTIVQRAPGARILGTATELNRQLSWWDLFAWWHVAAMYWSTPGGGNRAHGGPIFAPWHRLYLRRLEQAIQAVTGNTDFGLPYWDWAEDGELSGAAQLTAPIWSHIGPPRGNVTTGPFGQLRIRLVADPFDERIFVVPARPIRREAGLNGAAPTLPSRADQTDSLDDDTYDRSNWDRAANSFRNKLEGWRDARTPPRQPPRMHNRVHVFMGGSMEPASSPNDPVFFLNHCNVDRQWEAWLTQNGRTYVPAAGQGPPGHRANDPMFSMVWPSMRPEEVLDPGSAALDYRYDSLPISQ
jgi:tyrosinase